MVETEEKPKIAFVFSGQAEMEPGAGRELIMYQPWVRHYVLRASEAVGRDLIGLCLNGTAKELNTTEIVQTLLYAISCGTRAAMEKAGVRAKLSTGFSLGTFPAAEACGMFSFEDGARLVEKRASMIALNSERMGGGAMCLVFADAKTVSGVCVPFKDVSISALNAPGRTSISGPKRDVEEVAGFFEAAGTRILKIPVEAISHHPSLSAMADRFGVLLRRVKFSTKKPRITMVSDATGLPVNKFSSALIYLLRAQLTGPVQWVKTVAFLKLQGVKVVVEVGAVSHLRRLLPGFEVFSVTDAANFELAVNALAIKGEVS